MAHLVREASPSVLEPRRRGCAKRHSRIPPSQLVWWASCQHGTVTELGFTRIENANCAIASEFEHCWRD
jgi:hypothetical protein